MEEVECGKHNIASRTTRGQELDVVCEKSPTKQRHLEVTEVLGESRYRDAFLVPLFLILE
jgi:hypothetical protein